MTLSAGCSTQGSLEQEVNASFNATDPITGNTQWSAKFTYDDNSNNVSTTDAQGHQRFSDLRSLESADRPGLFGHHPDVSFFHDGTGLGQVPNYSKGQVTKVSSSVTESRYTAFDNLGRIKSSQQITNGVTYNFADYTYDLGAI